MRKEFVTPWRVWLLAGLLIFSHAAAVGHAALVLAAPIMLRWSPAPDNSIQGYAVYYGRTNEASTMRVDSGASLTVTLSDLVVGVTYRIYAVSYNAQGIESTPSNEVLYTPSTAATPPPPGARLQIAQQSNGSMNLTCHAGTNYPVCAIQFASTPDASYWQTLTNVPANQLGDIMATDISANRVPQRFYRLALSAQPLISRLTITRLPDGSMRLDWMAPPLSSSQLLAAPAPDASAWPARANVTSDAEGRAFFIDTTARTVPSRYYRVAYSAQPLAADLKIARLPNGQMRLDWTAPPSTSWRVMQAPKPNATFFPSFVTVTTDADGHAFYIDPTATTASSRFYRISTP